jgi:hypothetical protein
MCGTQGSVEPSSVLVRPMSVKTLVWAVGGPMLLLIVLSGCAGSAAPSGSAESTAGTRGELTDREYASAVDLARLEVREGDASISSATVRVGHGRVTDSNLGYSCESGRLLHVKLIGTFPHIVTSGHPQDPKSTAAPEDFTVHAVLLTADAESGRACLKGVQTGDVAPEPESVPLGLD